MGARWSPNEMYWKLNNKLSSVKQTSFSIASGFFGTFEYILYKIKKQQQQQQITITAAQKQQ